MTNLLTLLAFVFNGQLFANDSSKKRIEYVGEYDYVSAMEQCRSLGPFWRLPFTRNSSCEGQPDLRVLNRFLKKSAIMKELPTLGPKNDEKRIWVYDPCVEVNMTDVWSDLCTPKPLMPYPKDCHDPYKNPNRPEFIGFAPFLKGAVTPDDPFPKDLKYEAYFRYPDETPSLSTLCIGPAE